MDELTFAQNLARRVGDILRDRYWNNQIRVGLKADQSVVTEADTFADEMIIRAIRENYPADALISEEQFPQLDHPADRVWVIDPLDGTANFSNGLPIWGVSIALCIGGWPEVGVLYFPLTGDLYAAKKGQGARLNGSKLETNETARYSFFICCSRTHSQYNLSVPYKTRIPGSVAFNLASVARGDAAINLEVAPKIWDVAAAWIILQEAGACVEILQGDSPFPIRSGEDYNLSTFSTIAAVGRGEMERAQQWIQPRTG
jgi:myo-inositol-1(or 4)-monophosphatase